jgi:hypothetical protein
VMVPLTWAGARLGQRLQRGGIAQHGGRAGDRIGPADHRRPWLMHCPACMGCWKRWAVAACPHEPGLHSGDAHELRHRHARPPRHDACTRLRPRHPRDGIDRA